MGRRRLPEEEKRVVLPIRVKQKIKMEIIKLKGYPRIIEEMLEKLLEDRNK